MCSHILDVYIYTVVVSVACLPLPIFIHIFFNLIFSIRNYSLCRDIIPFDRNSVFVFTSIFFNSLFLVCMLSLAFVLCLFVCL